MKKLFGKTILFVMIVYLNACQKTDHSMPFNKDKWVKAGFIKTNNDSLFNENLNIRDLMKDDLITYYLHSQLRREDIVDLLGKPLDTVCCFHRWMSGFDVGLNKNSPAYKLYGDSLNYFDTFGRWDYELNHLNYNKITPLMRYYVGYSPSGRNVMIIVLDKEGQYLDVLFQEAM